MACMSASTTHVELKSEVVLVVIPISEGHILQVLLNRIEYLVLDPLHEAL